MDCCIRVPQEARFCVVFHRDSLASLDARGGRPRWMHARPAGAGPVQGQALDADGGIGLDHRPNPWMDQRRHRGTGGPDELQRQVDEAHL